LKDDGKDQNEPKTSIETDRSMAEPAAQPKQYFTGIVKMVLDGGAVVIRGQPRNGPPPERTLALAEIEAPRLARRPGPNNPEGSADEPFAWEAREFLRKLLVGKSVLGCVSHTVPSSGREYGVVLYGSNVSTRSHYGGPSD